jgi:hypothetical protein
MQCIAVNSATATGTNGTSVARAKRGVTNRDYFGGTR